MSYPAADNHHGQLESLSPAARHWLDGGQAWWAPRGRPIEVASPSAEPPGLPGRDRV
jgi:hypothetical protein